MVSQKHVFWQALVVTIAMFIIGIMIGIYFESSRTAQINELYLQSEIDLLDTKTLTEIFSIMDLKCEIAVQENINFANKIYEEASLLDRFEDKARVTEQLEATHKRYDVLRVLLWVNSVKLKEKCKSFHTVVYFYKLKNPQVEQEAEQNIFSQFLLELKDEQKDKIILIPIAADVELDSLNMLKEEYDIDKLPVVLIDEKTKIDKIEELKEIEKYIK